MPIAVAGIVTPTPSTDSTSPDGLIRARVIPEYAGVFITVDFRSLIDDPGFNWANPFRATVFRTDQDGNTVIVRGADQRTRYGGLFDVFDDEVRFGQIYTYYVEGHSRTGALGRKSYGASVLTWAPATSVRGVWIKNLVNSGASTPVRTWDWSKHNFESNTSKHKIMSSPSAAFNIRVRNYPTSTLSVLTQGEGEYLGLLEAVEGSVVFITSLYHSWKRDGWYLVEGIESSRVGPNVKSSYDQWDLALTKVDRPSTKGQNAPVFPWYNLDDRLRDFPTYNDATASGRLYRDGVNPDA